MGSQFQKTNSVLDISQNTLDLSVDLQILIPVLLDDIRFWNIVRTEEQINAAKGIVVSRNSEGLQTYWGMNEGSGNICFDATNNGNHLDSEQNLSGYSWSSDEPGILLGGLTNNWGEYSITQIPYGNFYYVHSYSP